MVVIVIGKKARNQKLIYGMAAGLGLVICFIGVSPDTVTASVLAALGMLALVYWSYRRRTAATNSD